MKVVSHSLCLAVLAGAATLSACATADDYHFSQLSGKRYFRAPIDTYAVSILRVDGRENVQKPALVDPGVRQVIVQGPPGATGGIGQEQTFSLNVAPCTRYYLVAVKPNPLDRNFSVRVDFQEPVPGCTAPHVS